MHRRILLVLSCSCFLLIARAQSSNDGFIDWSENRPLAWADYQGTPDASSSSAASTSTLVQVQYGFKNQTVDFHIRCCFSPTRSWGLHKDDYILSHEQGHFDISELFARKLCSKLRDYSFNPSTYQKDLDRIYNSVMKERQEMQDQYDRETNHSIDRTAQAAWKKKIAGLLRDFSAYANYR